MGKEKNDPKWSLGRRHRRSTLGYAITVKKDGIPTDITDWTIYFMLKKKMGDDDADAIISKKITSHADPGNGKTIISLTADDTDIVGSYYYSIDYKDDEDNEGVLLYGRIEFEETTRHLRD